MSNPAGGNQYELDDIDSVTQLLHKDLDQNGRDDSFSEYYFSVQASLKYCRPGGQICIILPEGVFANSTESRLREFISNHLDIKAIISLPRGIFYKGTTTRRVTSVGSKSHQKFSILYGIRNETPFSDLDTRTTPNYSIFLASIDNDKNYENKLATVLEQYQNWVKTKQVTTGLKVATVVPTIKHVLHHQPPLIEPEAPLFDQPPQPTRKITTKIASSLKGLFRI